MVFITIRPQRDFSINKSFRWAHEANACFSVDFSHEVGNLLAVLKPHGTLQRPTTRVSIRLTFSDWYVDVEIAVARYSDNATCVCVVHVVHVQPGGRDYHVARMFGARMSLNIILSNRVLNMFPTSRNVPNIRAHNKRSPKSSRQQRTLYG